MVVRLVGKLIDDRGGFCARCLVIDVVLGSVQLIWTNVSVFDSFF